MQLECEQCGAPMREADLKLDRGIAVCARCGGVRVLPEHVGRNDSTTKKSVAGDDSERESGGREVDQSPVPVPSRFEVQNQPNELTIRWRWFHPSMIFMLFFAIAWDSFLVGWYSIVTSFISDGKMPTPFLMIFILFPLAHVAVGVGLTYFAVSGLLNTTTVRAGRGSLSVTSGPIPTFKNVDLDSARVEKIYCQSKLKKHGGVDTTTHGSVYDLYAVVDNRQVKLVGWLRDADEAKFLEQQLERFLKIGKRD